MTLTAKKIQHCLFSFLFFLEKKSLLSSDLVSRINNLVSYNLPDSYLDIPVSIFTINNITLGNKDINNYTIKCHVYIIVDHTQLKKFQTYLAYCC